MLDKDKEIKCAVVERFNKTLKNKMFRYFTKEGTHRYRDVLDHIVSSYNNSYHSSIKMAPNEVNSDNVNVVFKNLYGVDNKREFLRKNQRPQIPGGSTVRKKYELKTHDRGYYPLWTDQLFEVFKTTSGGVKPYYLLRDQQGNVDPKRYYADEIQKVKSRGLERVEKVIRQRKFKGRKQFFVKWLNYPDTFNSWIDAKDLTKING